MISQNILHMEIISRTPKGLNLATQISIICLAFTSLAFWGCSDGNNQGQNRTEVSQSVVDDTPKANPKGIGEVKNVALTDPLEESMLKSGKAIYEMKCSACHKLTEQRVVGPGWAGITNKRRPEWIMNMITNVEVMLEEDSVAQKLLEECLTRMPNQGLSVSDARDVLEYMRQNDVEKTGIKDEALTNQ